MEGYKGFDKELKYKGVQYEFEKEFAINKDLDNLKSDDDNGLHFSKYPLDMFGYCAPVTSKFAKVESEEVIDKNPGNWPEQETKVFTNKLKICKEIRLSNMVHAAVEYIKDNIDSSKEQKADKANNWSVIASVDNYSSSINTGHRSTSTNIGNCSAAINTGDRSVAASVGYRSLAENAGLNSISSITGNYSVAKNIGSISIAANTGECSASSNTGFRSAAINTGMASLSIDTGNSSAATNVGYNSNATARGDDSAATNTGDESIAISTGDNSAATNTGYKSAAVSTSYKSIATNTGDDSVSKNTGENGVAINTGDWSAAIVTGENSIAVSTGCKGFAKGPLGSWIVISEWMCGSEVGKDGCILKDVKSFKVDGKEILPDTFYRLEDGKPVVVVDEFNEEMKEFM